MLAVNSAALLSAPSLASLEQNLVPVAEQTPIDASRSQGSQLAFDALTATHAAARHAGQPPLQLAVVPSPSRNESMRLSNLSSDLLRKVNGYLSPKETAALIETSLSLRWPEGVRYTDSKKYRLARNAYRASARVQPGGNPFAGFVAACKEIAHARALRGEPYAQYSAMCLAGHLGRSSELPLLTCADERLLVDAASATSGLASDLYDLLLAVREAARSPATDASKATVRLLQTRLMFLENALARAATDDMRSPAEGAAITPLPRTIHYLEHFADEPCQQGDTVQQTHRFENGSWQTQRHPRPDPQAGESAVRFRFGPEHGPNCSTYVHIFNVARPTVDMDSAD